jgi:DNA-binding transcriptional LysR family regulator
MDWNDLKFFLAVARAKSLSGAANQLSVSTSTVYRRVQALEGALSLKLFDRFKDGYIPTEEGRELLSQSEAIEEQLIWLEHTASGSQDGMSGLVRIALPELIGQELILPEVGSFLAQNPRIRLEISSSVKPIQLTKRESDIAVRLVRPKSGTYKMRSVGIVEMRFYAAETYLSINGIPRFPEDLTAHRVIGWTDELRYLVMSAWLEEVYPADQIALRLTSLEAQLKAVNNGAGIAVLPTFVAEKCGLVPVLSDTTRLELDVWVLVQEDSVRNKRVSVARDFVVEILSARLQK